MINVNLLPQHLPMKLITFFLLINVGVLAQTSVGFQSITRFDASRAAVKEQSNKTHGRIIQINLWYPSVTLAQRMTFSDYVGLSGLELDSSRSKDWHTIGVNRYFAWPESAKADKTSFLKFLDSRQPLNAFKSSNITQDKLPLIMLVHGYAADYAFLAESLAAAGFIVLQVPVKGTTTTELDYEGKGLETQVLDYEFALQILQSEFSVDPDIIGIAGFSFGGQSAIALSLRNGKIKSVVSLDGGIGSALGAQLLKSQAYYDISKLNKPLLHLYNARDNYTDLSWIKSTPRAGRWMVSMKNMDHGHFTSFGMLNKWLPGIMGPVDPGRGYETVIELTKAFFVETLIDGGVPGEAFVGDVVRKHPWMSDTIEKIEFRL